QEVEVGQVDIAPGRRGRGGGRQLRGGTGGGGRGNRAGGRRGRAAEPVTAVTGYQAQQHNSVTRGTKHHRGLPHNVGALIDTVATCCKKPVTVYVDVASIDQIERRVNSFDAGDHPHPHSAGGYCGSHAATVSASGW